MERQATTLLHTWSKKSKLNFIIWTLGVQTRNKISNSAMDEWFRGMAEVLVPRGEGIENNMPKTRYEARTVISKCGLDYITIDDCPCDETIYYGKHADLIRCLDSACGLSRHRDDLIKKDVPLEEIPLLPFSSSTSSTIHKSDVLTFNALVCNA